MLPRGYTVEIVKGGGLEGPRGILFITLIEGQHLPKTDMLSKTDCYVRCSCCCMSCHHGLVLMYELYFTLLIWINLPKSNHGRMSSISSHESMEWNCFVHTKRISYAFFWAI